MDTLAIHPSLIKDKFFSFELANAPKLFSQARKGISPAVFYDFAQAINMPEKALAALINVSARTVSNYRGKKKKLDPAQSEHLLKLMALYEKGESMMGSINEFNYWLNKPFWDSEESPSDWLITPGGVDLVSQELDRISMGYPV